MKTVHQQGLLEVCNMKWIIKVGLPILVVGLGFGAMKGVTALGNEESESEAVDTRPTVKVTQLSPVAYPVEIEAFGELSPLESTNLSAQVSGEITSLNPQFLSGGIVKRGEVLFTIEKDAYEAALLQAQANLASAESALIQEKALARVAEREAASLPDAQVTDLYLRKPQILSAEAALKAAQAQLKIAKRDLDNCEVSAPYDALIVSRSVGSGDFVTAGSSAALLYNIEVGEVVFPLARFDQAFLPGQLGDIEATITLMNRQDDIIQRVGAIHRDTGIVDASTRMTHLVARIEDPYGIKTGMPALKFGSYTQVQFPGKTLENIYKIPQELINKRQIWILDDEDKMVPKTANVVREVGSDFLIRADIDSNDRIVMTLPEYPQNGMAVKVIANEKLIAKQP